MLAQAGNGDREKGAWWAFAVRTSAMAPAGSCSVRKKARYLSIAGSQILPAATLLRARGAPPPRAAARRAPRARRGRRRSLPRSFPRRALFTARASGARAAVPADGPTWGARSRAVSCSVRKKSPLSFDSGLTNTPGSDLLSHAVSHAVPSAVAGLTSVFGMGTGVTLLL